MSLKKAKQLLLPALRQHQHNDCSGLIPAYDFETTNKLISELLKQRQETRPHETIVNFPKPHTAEFLTFLLVNALRNLNEAQRHNLAISLAVRDPLFTIEEYEKQKEN